MEEKKVHIPSISCGHCVMTIKKEIGEIDGISAVEGDETDKDITFKWEKPATWEMIEKALIDIGYPAD